jgi:hypothetical protein
MFGGSAYWRYCVATASLLVSAGANAEDASRWTSVFDASARYYSWSNSLGGSGTQLYIPFAVQTTGRPNDDWKAEFLIRSGYIWSRQSSPNGSAEAASLTDTTVGSTFTYFGWNGVQPFVSMNVNMPTADHSAGSAPTARPDSDLVATPIFGQGWNVGPSVGASFAFNPSLIGTLSFGYTYRGPFEQGPALSFVAPSGLTPPAGRLKPGDVSTLNAGLGYQGDRLSAQLSLSYSVETTTYHEFMPLYRAGDRFIIIGKAGYAWNDNWSSRLSSSFSHFNPNLIAVAGLPDLVRETMNSNSDVFAVNFDTSYARDNYSIGPTVGYLFRDHNGYDPVNVMFVPAKTSWSAGVSAQIAPTKSTNVSLLVQHIWVHEDENPAKFAIPGTAIPAFATNGWVVSVGGNVQF